MGVYEVINLMSIFGSHTEYVKNTFWSYQPLHSAPWECKRMNNAHVLCLIALCLWNVNAHLSASYWNTVSYNAIWGSGTIEDYVVKSRCSSSSWHLFKIDLFFVDCLCFHFMLVATLPLHHYHLSQSVTIPCRAQWGMSWGGGVVHIRVNDTETICPEWKRNGRICWWRKGCKVMEGW